MDNQEKSRPVRFVDGLHYESGQPIRVFIAGGTIERIEPITGPALTPAAGGNRPAGPEPSAEASSPDGDDGRDGNGLMPSIESFGPEGSCEGNGSEPSAESGCPGAYDGRGGAGQGPSIEPVGHCDNGSPGGNGPEGADGRGLPLIGPGLVDLQINGFCGIDFNASPLDTEAVRTVTRMLQAEGVTTYYPTVVTNSDEAIEKMVRSIAQACAGDSAIAESIAGIHLEGPFISPEDGPRGAHSRRFVKAPDWELFERWQRAADGRIRIVTLSPEWEEAPAFIASCVRHGIVASIGHTAATPEQIRAAVRAGASMSTHLGNGAHQMLPRHPNYIWEQLAEDRLAAGVIADGFHLPASVLNVFRKTKGSRMFLVSDAVYLSGLVPGAYETHIGGRVVLTEEGRLHLADNPGLLAGSVQMLLAGVAHLARSGVCSPAEAWELASVRPASLMGLAAGSGLTAGAPADLVAYRREADGSLAIRDVYKSGCHVAGSNVTSSSSQV